MNKLLGIAPLLALTLLGVSCSHEQAGVISETTNGATLSGILTSPDGTPRPDAFVELRSIESCSGCTVNEVTTTITNSSGSYTFNNIEPGSYVVYSAPAPESAMGLNVVVPGNVQALDLPEAMLTATDSIAGTIRRIRSLSRCSEPASWQLPISTGVSLSEICRVSICSVV